MWRYQYKLGKGSEIVYTVKSTVGSNSTVCDIIIHLYILNLKHIPKQKATASKTYYIKLVNKRQIMNYAELNNFVKHYMEYDKTQRAIMLTGDWGCGKSHYIQNELIPFLSKEENGNYQCIVVSLYGLNKLSEISKTIYLESRMKFLNKKSEKTIAGKIAAKTILKGITSFFSIDISKSDDEMTELYESIDLSEKLIILEDVERSNIDILDVLGYVNNLVEQDGVKILLVSNENEIIKFHYSEPDENGEKIRIPDDKSIEYLKIKEKTVSDTVLFHCNFYDAIKAIISCFKNDKLNFFTANDKIENILGIMILECCYNLRSLIYACQKTADIFDKSGNDDSDFKKNVFYGTIAFCLRISLKITVPSNPEKKVQQTKPP